MYHKPYFGPNLLKNTEILPYFSNILLKNDQVGMLIFGQIFAGYRVNFFSKNIFHPWSQDRDNIAATVCSESMRIYRLTLVYTNFPMHLDESPN